MVAWFLMKPDENTTGLIGVALFESKEAHMANANSPEQHEASTNMTDYLVSEPLGQTESVS